MPINRPVSRLTPRTPRLHISGPPELLQAVPYLLGFHPSRSLVLVGLHEGHLVVTARLDLDGADGLVADTVAAMARAGSSSLVAAVYDDDVAAFGSGADEPPYAWDGVVGRVCFAAETQELFVLDVVTVRGRRWRSLLCEPGDCCPPAGTEVPDAVSSFAAEATLAGRVPLASRSAAEALLDPLPDPDPDVLARLIGEQENAAVAAVLDGSRVRHDRAVVRALFAAARASQAARWSGSDPVTMARFAAALSVMSVRDPVWMGVDDGRIDGRALWRELGRRLPAPYSAAPLFLFGWASWRAGDGAQASMAAERAVTSDPSYSAADLLLAALNHGVDPRALPRLRMPRSGRRPRLRVTGQQRAGGPGGAAPTIR